MTQEELDALMSGGVDMDDAATDDESEKNDTESEETETSSKRGSHRSRCSGF